MTFSEAMAYLFEKPLEKRRVTREHFKKVNAVSYIALHVTTYGSTEYRTLGFFCDNFEPYSRDSSYFHSHYDMTTDDICATDWKVIQ